MSPLSAETQSAAASLSPVSRFFQFKLPYLQSAGGGQLFQGLFKKSCDSSAACTPEMVFSEPENTSEYQGTQDTLLYNKESSDTTTTTTTTTTTEYSKTTVDISTLCGGGGDGDDVMSVEAESEFILNKLRLREWLTSQEVSPDLRESIIERILQKLTNSAKKEDIQEIYEYLRKTKQNQLNGISNNLELISENQNEEPQTKLDQLSIINDKCDQQDQLQKSNSSIDKNSLLNITEPNTKQISNRRNSFFKILKLPCKKNRRKELSSQTAIQNDKITSDNCDEKAAPNATSRLTAETEQAGKEDATSRLTGGYMGHIDGTIGHTDGIQGHIDGIQGHIDGIQGHTGGLPGQGCVASALANDPVCMTMLQKLAFNALHLSAPASSLLLHQRRQSWVQLSGHPGSLAPAGPGTIWKKRAADPTETDVYKAIMEDSARVVVPTFFREIQYSDDYFIEMQDLLYTFKKPSLMDVKMGIRTFLEGEVANTKLREDLYQKMVNVSPDEPTAEERSLGAVTKRRYMEFRDNLSSSRDLGFRVEAMKIHGSPTCTDLKTVRGREEVVEAMATFTRGRDSVRRNILTQLQNIRQKFEQSDLFKSHEVIGSSILIVYDDTKAGAWMIDFAKTRPLPEGLVVTHREPWVLGNHEEGFLTGLDNLIDVMEEVKTSKFSRPSLFKKFGGSGSNLLK